jgi:hypothetical protein
MKNKPLIKNLIQYREHNLVNQTISHGRCVDISFLRFKNIEFKVVSMFICERQQCISQRKNVILTVPFKNLDIKKYI